MTPRTTERTGSVTMHRATPADFDEVLEVVQDAARRILEKGIHQWRLYLTDAGVLRVRARVDSADGQEVYLAQRNADGRAVGVISIEWSDRYHWAERGDDGFAGYIHMLSVHRLAAGTGLGGDIVRWAEQLIGSRGRSFARLDCWAGSTVLGGYYERLGFMRVGQAGGADGWLLMEKRVTP